MHVSKSDIADPPCVRCDFNYKFIEIQVEYILIMYAFSESYTIFVIFFLIGTITDLAFFGGTHLVSASEDQTICIWECGSNWDCLHVLKGHKFVTNYEHCTDILESIIFQGEN